MNVVTKMPFIIQQRSITILLVTLKIAFQKNYEYFIFFKFKSNLRSSEQFNRLLVKRSFRP